MHVPVGVLVFLLMAKKHVVSGSTPVAVRCENCKGKYYYELKRTAKGGALDKWVARAVARQRLRRMLASDCEAVPCPECGWYQEEMVPLVRRSHRRWLQHVGMAVGFLGPLCFLPAFILILIEPRDPEVKEWTFPIMFGGFAAGFFLGFCTMIVMVLRNALNARYDPNDPETEAERIELGRELTITRAEAEAMLEDD
jgi:hypothetical protein